MRKAGRKREENLRKQKRREVGHGYGIGGAGGCTHLSLDLVLSSLTTHLFDGEGNGERGGGKGGGPETHTSSSSISQELKTINQEAPPTFDDETFGPFTGKPHPGQQVTV